MPDKPILWASLRQHAGTPRWEEARLEAVQRAIDLNGDVEWDPDDYPFRWIVRERAGFGPPAIKMRKGMDQRDYELAALIQQRASSVRAKFGYSRELLFLTQDLADALARRFIADDPGFDGERFYNACVFDEDRG